MEPKTHLVEYLRGKYGLSLTPKQLSQEIPIPEKQQSVKRQDKTFPIPHKNVGRNVYYSIYAVADFLLDEQPAQVHKVKKEVSNIVVKTRNRNKADERFSDISQYLRGFVVKLEIQQANIGSLIYFFKRKIAYNEMQKELTIKGKSKRISTDDGGKI